MRHRNDVIEQMKLTALKPYHGLYKVYIYLSFANQTTAASTKFCKRKKNSTFIERCELN